MASGVPAEFAKAVGELIAAKLEKPKRLGGCCHAHCDHHMMHCEMLYYFVWCCHVLGPLRLTPVGG